MKPYSVLLALAVFAPFATFHWASVPSTAADVRQAAGPTTRSSLAADLLLDLAQRSARSALHFDAGRYVAALVSTSEGRSRLARLVRSEDPRMQYLGDLGLLYAPDLSVLPLFAESLLSARDGIYDAHFREMTASKRVVDEKELLGEVKRFIATTRLDEAEYARRQLERVGDPCLLTTEGQPNIAYHLALRSRATEVIVPWCLKQLANPKLAGWQRNAVEDLLMLHIPQEIVGPDDRRAQMVDQAQRWWSERGQPRHNLADYLHALDTCDDAAFTRWANMLKLEHGLEVPLLPGSAPGLPDVKQQGLRHIVRAIAVAQLRIWMDERK